SRAEGWASSRRYGQQLRDLIEATIAEGRATGEFERKTPADEAARAIMLAMQPFMDPLALQHNLDAIPDGCNAVISLILR
ncbi:TetR/AcrR family transcriptional regulator, partial [Acinetobacter baumannii]